MAKVTQQTTLTAFEKAQKLIAAQVKAGNISASDAAIITKYVDVRLKRGKSKSFNTIKNTVCVLVGVRAKKCIKPYDSGLTHDDFIDCFEAMKSHYSQNTQRLYHAVLVTFMKYGNKTGLFSVDMSEIKECPAPEVILDSVKPSDILTEEQINSLIAHCHTARDKAMIAVLAETGCRPVEITLLKWSDVIFGANSVQLWITDGKKRTVRKMAFVYKRQEYLIDLRKSQAADLPGVPVFQAFVNPHSIKLTGTALQTNAIRSVIHAAADEAGIKLPPGACAKLFRASSVTNKIKAGVNSVAIAKSHWSAGAASQMLRHYEKVAGEDTESMILSADGATVQKVKPKVVSEATTKKVCTCGHENPAGAPVCLSCGCDLTGTQESELERLRRENAEAKKDIADLKAMFAAFMATKQ